MKTILDVPKSFVKNDGSSKFDVPGGQSSYFSAKGEGGFGTQGCSNTSLSDKDVKFTV